MLNDNDNLVSWNLDTVAHEMYHNYQYSVVPDQYANNANREADANLFANLVERQANVDFGTSAILKRVEVTNPTTQAQKDFNTAWDNFNSGNVSQSNYNLLVNNFFAGSAVGSGYTFSAPISTNEPQFLKDLAFPPDMGDGSNPTNPNPY